VNQELPEVKAGFIKKKKNNTEEPEIKLPTSTEVK